MLFTILILIFLRPLISSLAFPYLNLTYSILLLAYLILWFFLKGLPLKKIISLKYPFILFILSIIISLIFSIDKINSLKQLYYYATALLIFLFAVAQPDENKKKIIRIMVFTGFIISILAIYQYFFGFKHLLSYLSKEDASNAFALDYIATHRVFFPFVTPNLLAGYLIMILPLTLTIEKKEKWIFLALISTALLLTRSLGAFLSLFMGFFIYFCLEGKIGKRRITFLWGILIVIIIGFILRTWGQEPHTQPFFSSLMRFNYWRDTLEIINAHPLTGVGLGNFNLLQSRYAHNSYLQICAEMGIPALLSFIWLAFFIVRSALANIGKLPYQERSKWIFVAMTIFLIHNLVDFTFFLPEVVSFWWLISGLIISET